MSMDWLNVQTRLGAFTLAAEDGAVVRIGLPDAPGRAPARGDEGRPPRSAAREAALGGQDNARNLAVLTQAAAQVREYVEGRRRDFTFPIRFEGTEFQRAVWEGLRRIPPGQTRTYRDVAAALGKPGAARAVGQANRVNPLPLVVPCHRVVASDGSLGGYMGAWSKDGHDGPEGGLKAEFLRLEGADLTVHRPMPA